MNSVYKPEGYNSLSPYLIVDNCRKMIELLTTIFNATELRKYENPDGSIMHVELRIDDTVIMLADSSETYPANNFLLHVYVPDVKETFRKAVSLGCEVVEEPANKKGDPDIRGTFKDFQGNMWAMERKYIIKNQIKHAIR
jgi:PhnB protein